MKNFAQRLKENILSIKEEVGVKDIEIQEVTKPNNVSMLGLVFKGESSVAPIVYINDAYEQYLNGKSMEDIMEEIVDTFHSATYRGLSAKDFLDYDKVKDKLIISVLNTELNKEMLDTLPHQTVEDVSLIARIEVVSDTQSVGTIKVSNELLDTYGVSLEELMTQAWANMKSMHPPICKDMIDVIMGMRTEMPEVFAEMMEENRGKLFVLQTDTGMFGGTYGFDKQTLTNVCEQIESPSIYIVPSSVNEVIIAPESEVDNPEMLTSIVSQVNSEIVPASDVLSDNIYFFDREKQILTIYS